MNNLIGSIIELESGERGKAAIKLKDNEEPWNIQELLEGV